MDGIRRDTSVVVAEVAPLADAFGAITAEGAPAALVIRRGSTVLLDIGSGTDRTGSSFTTSTPVLLCSVIKPAVALAALMAVADGALDLDDRVVTHWPAFGANGKEAVTVRHVLSHAAGVPGWREPFTSFELADLLGATSVLARTPPWWTPGEPGEHATSYGHLVDSVLRHATGRGLSAWWPAVRAARGVTSRSPRTSWPSPPLVSTTPMAAG